MVKAGVVHLFAAAGTADDIAACGLYGPQKMSGNVADVTCGGCKRSRLYKAVTRGDYKRNPRLHSYRQGLS